MSEQIDPSEQGTFNSALEYLRTLTIIEREILDSFIKQDYEQAHRLLDMYWIELSEWFTTEENFNHDNLRREQHEAFNRIFKARMMNKKAISFADVNTFYNRLKALNKVVHRKGLRMPKKDDPAYALGGS